MPMLAAARDRSVVRSFVTLLVGLAVGSILILGGVVLAVLIVGGGVIERFAVPARPSPPEVAAAVIAWTFALVVPAAFAIVGASRVAETLGVAVRRPRVRPAARAASSMPDDHTVASRVLLPDGRVVPELIVGPFGVVVVGELPPAAASRHRGHNWEIRVSGGRWVPFENPLDRTVRDAERVRRWLAQDDRDHVVRVHAVVVDGDHRVERTPNCAVIAPHELPIWLTALPVQRSFGPDRRARVVDLVAASLA